MIINCESPCRRFQQRVGALSVPGTVKFNFSLLSSADVEAECRDTARDNDQLSGEVEQLWAEKQLRERQIEQLELELDQERHMADNLVAAMQPHLR